MANKTKCPVCEKVTVSESARDGKNDLNYIDCSNCGRYTLGGIARSVLSSGWAGNKQVLAHWIRKRASVDSPPFILNEFLELVRTSSRFPNAHEQKENLLLALGDALSHPGEEIVVDADHFQAATGAATAQSFAWLLKELVGAGTIKGMVMQPVGSPYALDDATLTLKGWQEYAELKRSDRQSRLAFMAMPFGVPEIDDVVKQCFKPAVTRAGFELRDVTDGQPAGLIDDHIRVGIRRSRLMLCELTHDNRGAYWEAGFAEGLGIPVIYTCREDTFSKIHFDTSHLNTIVWDPSNLDAAASHLAATIRATLPMEAKMED